MKLSTRQKTIGTIIGVAAVLFYATLPSRPVSLPGPEADFVAAATNARNAWVNAPNDLAKIGMRQARAVALCRALPNLTASGWDGRISKIEPNPLLDFSGKATARIVIALTSHLTLSTPSSPLFNMPGTLVEAGTPIYLTAKTLRDGDAVKFSARFLASDSDCMTEESFTSDGSMRNPEFKIVLTALGKN